MFKCNDVKQVFAVAYVNKLRAKAAAELKVNLYFCGCERRKKKKIIVLNKLFFQYIGTNAMCEINVAFN